MIKTVPGLPHRRTIRLKGWDYSGEGWYFVTLVAFRRECLFGVIHAGEMTVNPLGMIVQECWDAIPAHFPNVILDAFVIMPNHVHGIVVIRDEQELPIPADAVPVGAEADAVPIGAEAEAVPVGARHASPLQEPGRGRIQEPGRPHGVAPGSLGAIIGSFKAAVSRRAGKELNSANLWQRNYYEHIICNNRELEAIRNYIVLNPERWAEDAENPSPL
jgi:putative transposase